MDVRNIQKTGGQSFVITLPKDWILSNFMKDKDKVKIFIHQRYLTIMPFSYKNLERFPVCEIDLMNKNQISREIIGYYLSGAENIIVKAKTISYEQRAAIRDISYRLIGCECLESTTNQMLLKNTSNLIHNLMPEYVNKIAAIIISMYKDTMLYLENGDKGLALDVIERDNEPDRLQLAIKRSNNMRLNQVENEEEGNLTIQDSNYYELVATRLERIADHIVRIGKYYASTDKKYRNQYKPCGKIAIKKTFQNLIFCQEMIASFDKRKAHQYLDGFVVYENSDSKKRFGDRDYLNIIIAESINRIDHYIANIAEEIIDHSNVKS